MKIGKHRRNVILKKSWYFTLAITIVAAVFSIWAFQQYHCCGMSDFWSGFWLAVGMICVGWTTVVIVLIKQGRV